MLTPALDAYGPFVVAVLIAFLLGAIVVGVIDYARWTGHHRAAAKRRHPAGRAIAKAATAGRAIAKGATAAEALADYGDPSLDAAAAHYDARPGRHRAPTPTPHPSAPLLRSPHWRHP